MIFFNFRPDRAREITRTFCADDFDGFDRGERIKTTYVCFTEYDETIPNKMVAFVKEGITNTFGEFLADKQYDTGKNRRDREICTCYLLL